jgi:hypothetical protein
MAVLRPIAIALAAATCLGLTPPSATPTSLTEVQAKAAFLYNLALFVEWPPSAYPDSSSIVIGSTRNPVTAALRAIDGRVINSRTVVVRELGPGDDPRSCQVLYVPEMDREAQVWIARAAQAPVLTVSDDERLMRAGGIIRISFEQARLKFDVDVARAERSGLRISSKVLRLARVLRDGHVVSR